MYIIGIDPGQSGGIAILSDHGELMLLEELPYIRDTKFSWVDGGRMQSMLIDALAGKPARAVVEKVWAMPKQGVSSSFAFGMGYGSILAILQARHIGIELVPSSQWKAAMGLTSAKKVSLDKARLLYPAAELPRIKDEGKAEALLLAHYGLHRPAAPPRVKLKRVPITEAA